MSFALWAQKKKYRVSLGHERDIITHVGRERWYSLPDPVFVRLVADVLDEFDDATLGGAPVVGPGRGAQALVPLQEGLVGAAVGEAGPPDAEVLHQAQVLDLVRHNVVVEHACHANTPNPSARVLSFQGLILYR